MSLSIILLQLLTGFAYGMLYFMIAAGLTVVLGVMNIINLAHGAFFLIGGYITYSLVEGTMGFWPALLVSVIVMAVVGIIIERILIKPVYGKELEQVLLTFGLSYILADCAKWIWGTAPHSVAAPAGLDFSIPFGPDIGFPVYRLFVILVGCALAGLLWYFESHTRVGAIIRAGVDDREMVSALGVNVGMVFTIVWDYPC